MLKLSLFGNSKGVAAWESQAVANIDEALKRFGWVVFMRRERKEGEVQPEPKRYVHWLVRERSSWRMFIGQEMSLQSSGLLRANA